MTNKEATFQEFRADIELMADIVEEKIAEGRDPHDAVWEEVDSSWWVIYNHANLEAIKFAREEPDEWKHLVSDDASFWEIVQAYAYKSVENELYDELRKRDVDL